MKALLVAVLAVLAISASETARAERAGMDDRRANEFLEGISE
jgi:hypothetical protein